MSLEDIFFGEVDQRDRQRPKDNDWRFQMPIRHAASPICSRHAKPPEPSEDPPAPETKPPEPL